MKKIFTILILSCLSICYSQTDAEFDGITMEICKSLNENKTYPDSTRISLSLEQHIPVFMQNYNLETEEQLEAMLDKVYARLQKNCNEFVEILIKSDRNISEWVLLEKAPVSKIQKKDCLRLTTAKHFYYLEYDGTKVHVTVENNKWTEKFEDGTYSILNFKWTGDCEYELEFVESNNNIRKNLSSKRDKYNYVLYEAKGNDFKFYLKGKTATVQATVLHAE